MDEPADLPFGADVGVAGTDPNEETVVDLTIGTEAGEEEIGAETSFIEPNVTADAGTLSVPQRAMTDAAVPDLAVFVGLRAPATPSLNATPWPKALGRLEWVGCGWPWFGAGDAERGEGAEAVDCGGPFAQADLEGSWVDSFGAVVVEDLLVLE